MISFVLLACAGLASAQLTIQSFPDTLTLEKSFNPVKPAYWTGFPKHRRTPFALSPDGKIAFIAYLDSAESGVTVQPVNPTTFASAGPGVTIPTAKEAGGLVAHNDGFALLTNEPMPSGTANAPPANTPAPVIYRFTNGKQTFKTWLNRGESMSPDLNGDLVYSEQAKLYGAYYVVTNYNGFAKGHFGDAIQYVDTTGALKNIPGATSNWGCSHNTGIAFEAADTPPFASICADDHTGLWLNTKTGSMSGTKLANEHVINGATNEAIGGTSGSYSSLARFPGTGSYIFTWVSRGSKDLTVDSWSRGVKSVPRWKNRHVAVTILKDKATLAGLAATLQVGAASGDSQVNFVTTGSADHSSAHSAAFDAKSALLTWEEIAQPTCTEDAMGCQGKFTGTYFQVFDSTGKKTGEPVKKTDVTVSGDIVNFPDGRVCWPYVNQPWDLSSNGRGGWVSVPKGGSGSGTVQKMSFACAKNGDSSAVVAPPPPVPESPSQSSTPSAAPVPVPDPAPVPDPTPAPTPAPAPAPQTPAAPKPDVPRVPQTGGTGGGSQGNQDDLIKLITALLRYLLGQ